jgi:hypothetical protein
MVRSELTLGVFSKFDCSRGRLACRGLIGLLNYRPEASSYSHDALKRFPSHLRFSNHSLRTGDFLRS